MTGLGHSRLTLTLMWACWSMLIAGTVDVLAAAAPMRDDDAVRIRMDNPLLLSRSDPLINPGAPSTHLHTIYGSNAFNITMDADTARSGSCSTTSSQDDLSSYWHPTLFYLEKNGTYTLPPNTLAAYYGPGSTTGEKINPIPKGLRFLIGSPMDHTQEQFLARIDKSGVNTIGVYACNQVWPNPMAIPDSCTGDISFMIRAPPCWDGKNLFLKESAHMAMVKADERCPSTHPVRIMGISFFAGTKRNDGGPAARGLMLANGDTTGRGFHLDFVAGWKDGILQAMLDNCRSPQSGQAIDTYNCAPMVPGGLNPKGECSATDMYYRESNYLERYSIKQLPGCNPVWPADQPTMPACNYTPNLITLMKGSTIVASQTTSTKAPVSVSTDRLPVTTGTGVWQSMAKSTTIVITTASVNNRCGAQFGTRTVCQTPQASCLKKSGAGYSVCSARNAVPTGSAPVTTGTGVWQSTAQATTIDITTASVSGRCGAQFGTRTVCQTPSAYCKTKSGAGISTCSPASTRVALAPRMTAHQARDHKARL